MWVNEQNCGAQGAAIEELSCAPVLLLKLVVALGGGLSCRLVAVKTVIKGGSKYSNSLSGFCPHTLRKKRLLVLFGGLRSCRFFPIHVSPSIVLVIMGIASDFTRKHNLTANSQILYLL